MADIPSSAAPPTTDGSSASPSPFIVQTSSPTRPRTNVGISTPLVQFDAESNGGPREVNQHPLAKPAFLSGLKYAGYLEPLDTSRNKIKQRFNHFLEKQNFKSNLAAFLENAGREKLGESMVRFVGTEEPHSPFVSLFVTKAIETTEAVKIYAIDPSSTSSVGRSSTQWTFLIAGTDASSEWTCKAKRFWPVKVRFEGPNNVQPAAMIPSAPPTRPRGKRRDTFQREIDLDAELKKKDNEEQEEKERVKLNTTKNSARPSDSPAISIDTKNTAPVEPPLEEKKQRTPITPTVLEAARHLGTSIVASLPPSMQQLPTVMQHRLKQWFDGPEPGRGRDYEEDGEEYDSEEDRRRRERRRQRRERRRWEEEGILRDSDRETRHEAPERRARKEERRRRRAGER
ncbi:hypothetical protein JCM16303_002059 [Sporobolomyces ruberrimus]